MTPSPIDNVHVDELLHRTLETGCSELYLRPSRPPHTHACDGHPSEDLPYQPLALLHLQQMIYAILTDEQIRRLEHDGQLSLPYALQHYALRRTADFHAHITRTPDGLQARFTQTPPDPPSSPHS